MCVCCHVCSTHIRVCVVWRAGTVYSRGRSGWEAFMLWAAGGWRLGVRGRHFWAVGSDPPSQRERDRGWGPHQYVALLQAHTAVGGGSARPRGRRPTRGCGVVTETPARRPRPAEVTVWRWNVRNRRAMPLCSVTSSKPTHCFCAVRQHSSCPAQ